MSVVTKAPLEELLDTLSRPQKVGLATVCDWEQNHDDATWMPTGRGCTVASARRLQIEGLVVLTYDGAGTWRLRSTPKGRQVNAMLQGAAACQMDELRLFRCRRCGELVYYPASSFNGFARCPVCDPEDDDRRLVGLPGPG